MKIPNARGCFGVGFPAGLCAVLGQCRASRATLAREPGRVDFISCQATILLQNLGEKVFTEST